MAFVHRRCYLLSKPEQRVLRTFQDYLVTPGKMLCFCGPDLKKHRNALRTLTEKDFLVKERFQGGYSLTREGYGAMTKLE